MSQSSTASLTPQARFDAVVQALGADRTEQAIALSREALDAGIGHPLFLNLVAFALEREGRLEEAAAHLKHALVMEPGDVLILTALGRTQSQQGRDAEALESFDTALAILPEHAPALNGRGLALRALGRIEESRSAHQRAADLAPDYSDPLGALADLALRDKEYDAARAFAERALVLEPQQSAAVLVMASLENQHGENDKSMARLDALLKTDLSPLHRSAAEQLKAEALDKDRPVEAFAGYTRANRLVRSVYAPLYESREAETAVPLCARLHAAFENASPSDWTAAPGGGAMDEASGHVFLVGFVRSGTTLLEQVLASHPDVVALEEQATLRAITGPFFESPEGLERLRTLGEAEAAALRAEYWARVKSFGIAPAGKVFVDKAPLSSLWMPMIAKLFPDAKVLLAIRDPRDVVISSFRHRFLINALTWPFTDLEDTARFYSGLMSLTALYRTLLPVSVYQHRHEDLIAEFDAEVGRICDFLGIGWADAMRDFAETAKRRDVRTPSAEQVRRGLNSDGVGRWRRYGEGVEPMLPILKPWVEAYGYPEAPPV